jgi:hypothetical protein
LEWFVGRFEGSQYFAFVDDGVGVGDSKTVVLLPLDLLGVERPLAHAHGHLHPRVRTVRRRHQRVLHLPLLPRAHNAAREVERLNATICTIIYNKAVRTVTPESIILG